MRGALIKEWGESFVTSSSFLCLTSNMSSVPYQTLDSSTFFSLRQQMYHK